MGRRVLRLLCIASLSFAVASSVHAQEDQGGVEVSGTVTMGSTGDPLPGANVLIEGTQRGAVTDGEGAYELIVPGPSAVLVFSSIGFEGETVEVGDQRVINVQLAEDVRALEDVVVLGYSAKTQRELPSAVATVSEEDLEDVTTSSVTEALQGKVPGLFVTSGSGEPGTGAEVRVRGTGSLSAGADPLYVVDGIIGGTVSPNDVASVTVLKDAAATALYGSRAANGVVVITTKSGRSGDTQVSVDVATGVNQRTNGNFDLMSGADLYDLQQQMGVEGLPEELRSRDTDWQDIAFRRGITNEVELGASGGNDETTFYVSGAYFREEGTLIATGMDRVNGRVNLEHAVSDRFSVTARASGEYTTRTYNPTGALYQAYTNLPWDQPRSEAGELRTGREPDWRGRDRSNFLYPLQYNWSDGRFQEFSGDVKLEYTLAPWVSFATTNRATLNYAFRESNADPRTSAGSANSGELNNSTTFGRTILTSNLFDLSKDLGAHSLSGIAGYEYQHNYADGLSGLGTGLFSGLEILDVTAEALSLGGYKSENAFQSILSQANYDYDDTYFASLSFRRDGSSRFGADDRYGNFYSIGGAWLASNEALLEGAAALDQLKLRGSYGTTGNAEIGNYVAQGLYGYSVQYAGQPGGVPVRLANPELTWEVARSLNLGVDASLWGRLDVSLDLYRRVNDDLLQNVILPGTEGIDSQIRNIGSVLNRGVELAVSSVNLRGGAFEWTTDANLSFNQNEVLQLNNEEDVFNGLQRIAEGSDLRTWYMRAWAGVDPETGDPLWEQLVTDEDGAVTGVELTSNYNAATLQEVGSATPNLTGGVRNTFRYRGFSLSALLNFVYGSEIYHSARELFDSDGGYVTYNYMALEDDWSRWQEPGDEATHPRPMPGGNKNAHKPSSRFLEDGSYLRLQNVTLSYALPTSFFEQWGLSSARVQVSGDNLLTLTGFSGMDPEVGLDGYASTKYPISRKVLVGLHLSF